MKPWQGDNCLSGCKHGGTCEGKTLVLAQNITTQNHGAVCVLKATGAQSAKSAIVVEMALMPVAPMAPVTLPRLPKLCVNAIFHM